MKEKKCPHSEKKELSSISIRRKDSSHLVRLLFEQFSPKSAILISYGNKKKTFGKSNLTLSNFIPNEPMRAGNKLR